MKNTTISKNKKFDFLIFFSLYWILHGVYFQHFFEKYFDSKKNVTLKR
jgi:hypothetical protein